MGKGGARNGGMGSFRRTPQTPESFIFVFFSLPLVAPAENFNPPTHRCNRL